MSVADQRKVPSLVSVRSPSLEVFLDDLGFWMADGEMFVPTPTSPPVDSPVRLDLRVGNDWRLIQGSGRVAWVREEAEAEEPERPAGFCVEFADLEKQSRKLLQWIVDDRRATEATEEAHRAASSRKSRIAIIAGPESNWSDWEAEKRFPWSLLAIGLGLLLLIAAVIVLLLVGRDGAAVTPPGEPAAATVEPVPEAALPVVAPVPEAPQGAAGEPGVVAAWEERLEEPMDGSREQDRKPAAPVAEDAGVSLEEDVTRAVESWADAWVGRRAAEYLAAYSQDFVPPGGMSRAEWELWRQEWIEQPETSEVEIEDLRIEAGSDGSAIATFEQSFGPDDHQNRVVKELRLVLEVGRWMILEERVLEIR